MEPTDSSNTTMAALDHQRRFTQHLDNMYAARIQDMTCGEPDCDHRAADNPVIEHPLNTGRDCLYPLQIRATLEQSLGKLQRVDNLRIVQHPVQFVRSREVTIALGPRQVGRVRNDKSVAHSPDELKGFLIDCVDNHYIRSVCHNVSSLIATDWVEV